MSYSTDQGRKRWAKKILRRRGVIQKWCWNKWPTTASSIFSSGLMWTIRQAGCGLEARCELVDYQLIMWHFLLVWIFAHFRLGELLSTKSKRLVELCWHHSGWLRNGRMQHFINTVWLCLRAQSGPLTWNWSDRFNFQIKSIWGQVAANVAFTWNQISDSFSQWFRATYLVCLVWSGNKTSVLKLPTHLSTNKPIFLPTNPSFYQQTHLSTNKSSQLATHTYLLNPPNLKVWSTFWTNPSTLLFNFSAYVLN